MKNRNAFTLIELLICIAIVAILVAMFIPVIVTAGKRVNEKKLQEQIQASPLTIREGDTVYIDGMDITGRVNRVYRDNTVLLLIKGTDGIPVMMKETINTALLRKIVPLEKQSDDWRKSR